MVFGAGVDDTEEGEHGFGLVAGFAEEATVIIIRVRVGGRMDQAERLEGCSRVCHGAAVGFGRRKMKSER